MTAPTDQIVSLFETGGIDTVFGVPCEQMDPYYSSLADSSVRHVLGRSEASAALMADGYARANSSPAPPPVSRTGRPRRVRRPPA